MDDEQLMRLLVRGWALHCATTGVNWSISQVKERAEEFEAFILAAMKEPE